MERLNVAGNLILNDFFHMVLAAWRIVGQCCRKNVWQHIFEKEF
jgi:hypothetical protein